MPYLYSTLPHPKPHLAFYIPVYPDVYPSGINVPKHFTIMLYSKVKKFFIVNFINKYLLLFFKASVSFTSSFLLN